MSSSSPPATYEPETRPQSDPEPEGRRPRRDDVEAALRKENARLRRERNDARRRCDRVLGELELEADENAALRRQLDDEVWENDRLRETNARLRRERDEEIRENDFLRRTSSATSTKAGGNGTLLQTPPVASADAVSLTINTRP